MFKDAKHAVRWAEARLNRSKVKNTIAPLLKSAQKGAGDLSAEDLDDLALTISSMAREISPPAGVALMAVYGIPSPERDIELADAMVLHNTMNLSKRDFDASQALSYVTPNQHAVLMRCVIHSERSITQGFGAMPRRQIYDLSGLTHDKYNKHGIADVYRLSQGMLRDWVDGAARQLEVKLDAIDMLSD